jgi:hypothetical protein
MNYEEICMKTSNIKELEAYNNFWNVLYEITDLTERRKDKLVSNIMEQHPLMSLSIAEMYLAELILEYINIEVNND